MGSILDSEIYSVISSVDTAAVDTEAKACVGPGREWMDPGPAVVLCPSLLMNLHSNPMNWVSSLRFSNEDTEAQKRCLSTATKCH